MILVGQALTGPKTSAPEDIKVHSVRYLRADHSLLGGVWIDDLVHVIVGVGRDGYVAPLRDSNGTRLGDSIYGVFVLQEAARLAGEATNALVMWVLIAPADTFNILTLRFQWFGDRYIYHVSYTPWDSNNDH